MKNRLIHARFKIPMNLQLFAENGGSDGNDNGGNAGGGSGGKDGKGGELQDACRRC